MVLDPLIQLSRKLTYRYSDGVLVQTKIAGEIVQHLTGAKKIRVIPNPLYPINTDTSKKINRIVTLGRLSVEKGHIHLIRAFSQIQNQDWSLAIVGDGPERMNLQKESDRLHVANKVKFYGHLKDFTSLLGESEIFVLPSLHEGFPNALLEAMSVPLASISSDCVAGPGEIIQNGINGLLVKPGDEKALAEAIELLILNSDLRRKLAQEAYKVREKYSFEKIAREYLDFLLPETSL
jgi:glycosyltransferase involved in cell wall biosynthesis